MYLRELTGLNTKQVVNNLNKIREKYKNFRKRLKDSVFSPKLQPEFCKGCLKYSSPQEIQGNLASKAKKLLLYPFLNPYCGFSSSGPRPP